jgi:hypothetical protein
MLKIALIIVHIVIKIAIFLMAIPNPSQDRPIDLLYLDIVLVLSWQIISGKSKAKLVI